MQQIRRLLLGTATALTLAPAATLAETLPSLKIGLILPMTGPFASTGRQIEAVGGYDGIRVIYKALETTKGKGNGQQLVTAMRGQTFESPRGPVLIDAQTGDITQDIYVRKVDRRNGQLWNIEIDTIKSVRDRASGN